MMSISFWIMKLKFPKLHLTAGRKGRCPAFWSFFGSSTLWTTSPLFCKHCAALCFLQEHTEKKISCYFFSFCFLFSRHKLTRHQYYLQLRKDILEDRLYCNEETGLYLVALALQVEFGDYIPEVRIKD